MHKINLFDNPIGHTFCFLHFFIGSIRRWLFADFRRPKKVKKKFFWKRFLDPFPKTFWKVKSMIRRWLFADFRRLKKVKKNFLKTFFGKGSKKLFWAKSHLWIDPMKKCRKQKSCLFWHCSSLSGWKLWKTDHWHLKL